MEKFLTRLEDECRHQIGNYDYYRHNIELLRDKVMFLRYEDLALNQTLYVDAITRFTGTPLSPNTMKKIIDVSTLSNKTSHRNDFYTTR